MLLIDELDRNTLQEASRFICGNEQDCISLSSLFHRTGELTMPSGEHKVFLIRDQDTRTLKGITTFSVSGHMLHLLRFDRTEEEESFSSFISREIPADRVFCVLGERNGTELISRAIHSRRIKEIDYTLMHFEGRTPPPPVPEGLNPVQCDGSHIDLLLPLQKGYEIEEVLLSRDDFDPDFCRLNLRRLLREQVIFCLMQKKADFPKAVAKGGTNAIGKNWCQLGGIYTAPAYRGNGCAAGLSRLLAEKMAGAGKKTALFVRDSNITAQKAYLKAGFIKDKPFRICYF